MTAKRSLTVWGVWAVAALFYTVAIINRTSLAALGPAAQDHFSIDATTLSSFAVLQLIVYAGLQIPVGLVLDRVGPTLVLLSGGVLMLVGQTLMATVDAIPLVILARVLVGAGDACTFISVMRVLGEWFPVRQLPVVSQITALLGQAGQLVAVTPLSLAVGWLGWAGGFLGIVAVGLLVTLLGFFVLRDYPGAGTALERMRRRQGRRSRDATPSVSYSSVLTDSIPVVSAARLDPEEQRLRDIVPRLFALIRIPGIRLAFWVHFAPPFAINVFVLLWGYPFLMGGVGLDRAGAAGLLSVGVVASMIAGLVIGPLTARFAGQRVWFVIAIVLGTAGSWIAVLLHPGTPPMWLLVLMIVLMAIGGPASMVAFEVVRTHAPPSQAGVATGLVNMGGFTASLLCILLVGVSLDLQGAGSPETYSMDAFRNAFALQLPFWGLGLAMMLVELLRTRRALRNP